MDLQTIKLAAQHMVEYIDQRGEDASLDILSAQCELMKERIKVIRLDRKPKLEIVRG